VPLIAIQILIDKLLELQNALCKDGNVSSESDAPEESKYTDEDPNADSGIRSSAGIVDRD
jgi:hypothetical protein